MEMIYDYEEYKKSGRMVMYPDEVIYGLPVLEGDVYTLTDPDEDTYTPTDSGEGTCTPISREDTPNEWEDLPSDSDGDTHPSTDSGEGVNMPISWEDTPTDWEDLYTPTEDLPLTHPASVSGYYRNIPSLYSK